MDEIIKVKGYQTISKDEYCKLHIDDRIIVHDGYAGRDYFFKKAEKFPIGLDNEQYRIDIYQNDLLIHNKHTRSTSMFSYYQNDNFSMLAKAVKKAEEVIVTKRLKEQKQNSKVD